MSGFSVQKRMQWKKLGQVINPQTLYPSNCPGSSWMVSHATNPVAEYITDDRFRIYFNCRDTENRSAIACAEINLNNPLELLALSQTPILSPGPRGLFDDSGVSMGCIVPVNGKRYLYYIGWNLGVTVPWRNTIGLAISQGPNQPFEKTASVPVMDRHENDPYSLSYPWVLHNGQQWQMWYGSNTSWGKTPDDMTHVIKYARSADGLQWQRNKNPVIDCNPENGEHIVVRPCVVFENNIYKMWYSRRGERYRIGYAESADGVIWQRQDDTAGLDVSEAGWDSESVAYTSIFDHNGQRFMLYAGNGYGKSGFGLAVLEA